MTRRQRLQPDRLPDPSRGCVEDPFWFLAPVLLPARQGAVGRGVISAHDQLVVARTCNGADVGTEWRVASLVAGNLDIIEPDRRLVVDCTEMKHQPVRVRWREATPVPDCVVERALADPGQL